MPIAHSTLTSLFNDIAAAIRSKKDSGAVIIADNFPSEILSIPADGITPSGTKNISSNGEYDVTEFASVEVAVPITTPTGKSFDVTVATEKVGSGVYATLVSGDSDIAAHYTEEDFAALINAINVTVGSDKAYILTSVNGNKKQVDTSYGCTLRRTTSSASGSGGLNRAVSDSGDATGGGVGYIRATSSGDIRFYSNSSTYRIAAGSYKVVVGW